MVGITIASMMIVASINILLSSAATGPSGANGLSRSLEQEVAASARQAAAARSIGVRIGEGLARMAPFGPETPAPNLPRLSRFRADCAQHGLGLRKPQCRGFPAGVSPIRHPGLACPGEG